MSGLTHSSKPVETRAAVFLTRLDEVSVETLDNYTVTYSNALSSDKSMLKFNWTEI